MITAERRIGKTSVIRKMAAETPEEFILNFADVGGLSSPLEFVDRVAGMIREHLKPLQRQMRGFQDLLRSLGGIEVVSVKLPLQVAPHWKALLEKAFDDLAEQSERKFVFVWDELPWMLGKIKKGEGGLASVIDLLDTLRGIRQTHANIRMIYTGSIGMHHVLDDLKDQGQISAPTNDMFLVEMPPIELAEAQFLVKCLFLGENLACEDVEACSAAIAQSVDCVPFYIHHVISKLALQGSAVTPASVDATVTDFLTNPADPWKIRHFSDRLKPYYNDSVETIQTLLNALARTSEGISLEGLEAVLQATMPDALPGGGLGLFQRKQLRSHLDLLQLDHYIAFDKATQRYHFRFELIRRWWQIHHDL